MKGHENIGDPIFHDKTMSMGGRVRLSPKFKSRNSSKNLQISMGFRGWSIPSWIFQAISGAVVVGTGGGRLMKPPWFCWYSLIRGRLLFLARGHLGGLLRPLNSQDKIPDVFPCACSGFQPFYEPFINHHDPLIIHEGCYGTEGVSHDLLSSCFSHEWPWMGSGVPRGPGLENLWSQ